MVVFLAPSRVASQQTEEWLTDVLATVDQPTSATRTLLDSYPMTMARAGRLCVQRGMTEDEAGYALAFAMYAARKEAEENDVPGLV